MEYGISILALVPMRKEPKDQSEMISQILFGQHFKILKIEIIGFSSSYLLIIMKDGYAPNNILKLLMKIMTT